MQLTVNQKEKSNYRIYNLGILHSDFYFVASQKLLKFSMRRLLVIYQHATYYATYFKEVALICML